MFDYVLKRSLQDDRIVTIMYLRGKDITQRDIRIMKLRDEYVEAYYYLRHQIRHFKKENILAVTYTKN